MFDVLLAWYDGLDDEMDDGWNFSYDENWTNNVLYEWNAEWMMGE